MNKEKNTLTKGKAEEIDILIGKNLRVLRKNKGLTQAQVAKYLGVSFQQIQKYERGTNRLSAGNLYKLSMMYDTSLYDFYAGLHPSYEYDSEESLRFYEQGAENFTLLHILKKIKDKELKASLIKTLKGLTREAS